MGQSKNPYLTHIHNVIPQLLAMFDMDVSSPTYGQGDRFRSAWKLIDFGNGTFQGAANGLARLLVNNQLPEYLCEESVLKRIDAMFYGAGMLRRANGSMEEAFPYESSFCVTSLVAYDLLTTIELLNIKLSSAKQKSYLTIVEPMIRFLHQVDETHAFISNHLATAAVALFKWSSLTGDNGAKRGALFLNRILQEQSNEGWFREYDGADPGYQTLCTYYLADLHRLHPEIGLLGPLRKSIQFLWYFAHPDGSFGGYYGSRNTRLYYPAGIELLGKDIPEAAALADFMRESIVQNACVTLGCMDPPNLIPMFNSYCWTTTILKNSLEDNLHQKTEGHTLPSLSHDSWQKYFKEAGLIVDKRKDSYTIISAHKGGVVYSYQGAHCKIDTGVVIKDTKGRLYSSQGYNQDNQVALDDDKISITAKFSCMKKQLPSPLQFILLRILNITVMRSSNMGNWIKKQLVRYLITGKNFAPLSNQRTINLDNTLEISDEFKGNISEFQKVSISTPFSAIHMASQGYWQRQDDEI